MAMCHDAGSAFVLALSTVCLRKCLPVTTSMYARLKGKQRKRKKARYKRWKMMQAGRDNVGNVTFSKENPPPDRCAGEGSLWLVTSKQSRLCVWCVHVNVLIVEPSSAATVVQTPSYQLVRRSVVTAVVERRELQVENPCAGYQIGKGKSKADARTLGRRPRGPLSQEKSTEANRDSTSVRLERQNVLYVSWTSFFGAGTIAVCRAWW
ncbi:uncharacterized protein J3D65DRAFT_71466 [Phyllosticta citribraziliensis]|uniref:Uncharacterized protein n=1 Tax=Phyllosticta citribraziliensis TaxID=989973 RepID=A0ABR1LHE4_9PEZI